MNPRIMIPNISKCLALATELVIRSMGYKLKIQQALELVCKQVCLYFVECKIFVLFNLSETFLLFTYIF